MHQSQGKIANFKLLFEGSEFEQQRVIAAVDSILKGEEAGNALELISVLYCGSAKELI